MITYFQAIILGLLQGLAELFPISSLGHSVILPRLLGWNIQQNDNFFLTFLVATHFATVLVLVAFYGREWRRILMGMGRSLRQRRITDHSARLGWLLVAGTVPAGVIGLIFQDQIRHLFTSARVAAAFLFINGFLLLGAEILRRRAVLRGTSLVDRLSQLSWWQAVKIGSAQALALIPGLSRSGASMGGGLLAGLSHTDAVNFAFLLATPIIGAAAVLKLPELFRLNSAILGPTLVGALAAAVAAYVAVRWITHYFKANTLTPFGIYCLLAGGLSSVVLLVR